MSRNANKRNQTGYIKHLLTRCTVVGFATIATTVVAAVSFAETQSPTPSIRDIKKIEELHIMEEPKIEKEILDGGYVCFKAFRPEQIIELAPEDLSRLHLRPESPTVKSQAQVTRWVLVSISCVKQ